MAGAACYRLKVFVPNLELIFQVLALSRLPYQLVKSSEEGLRLALSVVFIAGLSQTLSQSVVLFAHRVRPRRFALSLLVGAGLYVFGFLFLVTSIWFVARYAFGETEPLLVVVRAVGLAYAPYLFSFIVLTPYFGSFFSATLALWNLSATLLALSVIFGVTLFQALLCSALGWLLLQVVQRTVGRPVQALAQRARHLAAGRRLEFNKNLKDLVRQGREK